jgi:hypothetical protein
VRAQRADRFQEPCSLERRSLSAQLADQPLSSRAGLDRTPAVGAIVMPQTTIRPAAEGSVNVHSASPLCAAFDRKTDPYQTSPRNSHRMIAGT